uniref:Uncharacterized protein n=1 Tax=Setaria viridis TaxID=4556 RepID=A0A4U6W5B7_SETVI|nr:hypothetical protein SEVIR_2G185400v2 [Setaria viridis]
MTIAKTESLQRISPLQLTKAAPDGSSRNILAFMSVTQSREQMRWPTHQQLRSKTCSASSSPSRTPPKPPFHSTAARAGAGRQQLDFARRACWRRAASRGRAGVRGMGEASSATAMQSTPEMSP